MRSIKLYLIIYNKARMLLPIQCLVLIPKKLTVQKSVQFKFEPRESLVPRNWIFFKCETNFSQTIWNCLPKVISGHTSFKLASFLFSFLIIIISCNNLFNLWQCTPEVLLHVWPLKKQLVRLPEARNGSPFLGVVERSKKTFSTTAHRREIIPDWGPATSQEMFLFVSYCSSLEFSVLRIHF